MGFDYDTTEIMQCTVCGHTQYYTSDRCLMCSGELKLADEKTTEAFRKSMRELREEAMAQREKKWQKDLNSGKFDYHQPDKNLPKCPLCQSTNIKQISVAKRAAHGYAFGLFSNTARSQWECLNCGNKF